MTNQRIRVASVVWGFFLLITSPIDTFAQSQTQASQATMQASQAAVQASQAAAQVNQAQANQAAAQQSAQAAAAAAAAAAQERQAQDVQRVRALIGIDPAAVTTVGLWPGPVVPCRLPKRERPYECQRILVGPALVLSRLVGEFIVARGDVAVAQGKRSWWADWDGAPLALAAGEVLYHVGSTFGADKDGVATIYRSSPLPERPPPAPPKPCIPACGSKLTCEDGQCVDICRPACSESQYCASDRRCYWIRDGRKTADPVNSR